MFAYIWPLALVVVCNTMYQICAKSVPNEIDPFASLVVTYGISTIVSAVLYFTINRGGHIMKEYTHMNLAPVVLGVVLVGLETGFIYAYKAGWQVSTASLVQSGVLAIALLAVGVLVYREALTLSKVAGVLICLVGLYFLSK